MQLAGRRERDRAETMEAFQVLMSRLLVTLRVSTVTKDQGTMIVP